MVISIIQSIIICMTLEHMHLLYDMKSYLHMTELHQDSNKPEVTPLLKKEKEKSIVSSSSKTVSLWSDTSLRQKCLLTFVISSKFAVFMCAGIPTSFFTRAIRQRGGSAEEASILMQAPLLTMAIASGLFGKYQILVGNKTLLLGGLLCFFFCQALFGLLDYVNNFVVFMSLGAAIRIFQGVGQGAYAVASLTNICGGFGNHVNKIFGIAETFAAIGALCGPPFGSLLYTISENIYLPFLISSLFICPLLPVGHFLLKKNASNTEVDEPRDITETVNHSASVFLLGTVTTIYGSLGIVDVLLSSYMNYRLLPVANVGLALLIQRFCQSIGSVVIGWVSSSGYVTRRIFCVSGVIGLAACPFILTINPHSEIAIYIFTALFGIFCASSLICSFGELIHLLSPDKTAKFSVHFICNSGISGVWNLAYGLGSFGFPLVGATLLGTLAYEHIITMLIVSGTCLSALVALLMAFYKHIQ